MNSELRYMVYAGSHHLASFAHQSEADKYADLQLNRRVVLNLQSFPECDCADRSWYGSYHDTQCPCAD
jgi:hypothetical protein